MDRNSRALHCYRAFMMDIRNLQTPEEMLDRWQGVECQCDPDVGHLCECCHDTQVLRELIRRTNALEEALKTIAEYGIGADRNDGICPYGCDCPHIAQEAIKSR
jgi:hypothetical protein